MERKEEQKKMEQENIEQKEYEPYYSKRPQFGNKGPSKIRQQFSSGMTYLLVIIVCVGFYFVLLRLDSISKAIGIVIDVLKPIIYGLVIAYLLNPIIKQVDKFFVPLLKNKMKLEKAKSVSRSIGIVAAIIFVCALVTALCNMLIPELYTSIRDLIIILPGQINEVISHIEAVQAQESTIGMIVQNLVERGTEALQSWFETDFMTQVNSLMSNITVGVVSVFGEMFNLLLGFIVSVYVLYGKEKFSAQAKKVTYALFNTEHANLLLHLTKKSNEIFGGFVIGKIIDSAIIGVLCFLVLSILNMPYTLLVSVIVGVTNVIPFFGPYIGAIPSAVLILLADPRKGLYFIIFIIILQQIDGNIIGPRILGDSTGLSAFWVLFSILVGGGLFGFIGMLMGVPTFAVIYYIVGMVVERKLEKKHLPLSSENYNEASYVNDQGMFVQKAEKEDWKEETNEKKEN